MFRKILLPSLFMFAVYSAASQQQPGKLTMEQGQVFTADVTVSNSITQQAMGQAIDFTVDGKARHHFKVTNASDDFYTLHHEAEKISFVFNGMGSKKSFDSGNKKDISGQWGEPVRKILAKKYDVVISTNGTVMKVNPESFPADQTDERLVIVMNMLRDLTSVTNPPKQGEAGFFKVLPETGAAVGETWKTTTSDSSGTSSTTYKIESIGDSTITVGFESNGKTVLKATLMGMESVTNLSNVTTGSIILNKQTGIIKEKISEMVSTGSAEIMGNTTPVNAKTNVKMIVTSTQPAVN